MEGGEVDLWKGRGNKEGRDGQVLVIDIGIPDNACFVVAVVLL